MFSSVLHRPPCVLGKVALTALVFLANAQFAEIPSADAATIAPPMLDITHQCDAMTKHNVTAMSECVVAESEARADLLQHWAKLPDDAAEKCIKLGRKAKRQPYTAMEKCLAPDLAAVVPASVGETKK